MIYNIDIAKQIAKSLLQIKAIILQPENPFKWASGWNSPIYCDNRKTLSYPEVRNYIRQSISLMIKSHYKGANIIAGVATAGIPHGVLVAEELGLPFIYVRSEAKKHGKKNQIEGHFEEGQSVILVEDLISSGKSSIEVVKVLRSKNLNVKGVVSIFTYGFQNAIDNFDKENCKYISLSDYNSLLEEAIKSQYIKEDDLSILKEWRINPSNWKR
tara:strand:+ start:3352 stop:3993 length:642 start_codon:yes stop_codon:yes gene_type:complete